MEYGWRVSLINFKDVTNFGYVFFQIYVWLKFIYYFGIIDIKSRR